MVFQKLNPQLQELINKRFKEPTLPQELGIPSILSGLNTLIIAQVGTGKTEAAMLPIFNFILEKRLNPISVLYITPLKALNRDLIERMLWWVNQLGIEISVRHGDTSAYERKLQVEFPPQILFMTLETLQPILTGKKIREHLRNVKYVVLDEIHECADSKRGVQLALALERLRELCGDFQLIMLSATVGDPEKVAEFFAGGRSVKIVKAVTSKQMDIKVINPKPKLEDKKIANKVATSIETAARLRTIMELIKNSRSTLTFTNTREFAEILASRIKTIDKKFPIEVHHSSLSKEVRIKAEKEFKVEKLKSLIATSSLQLGIDIGSVDLVLQYMSPRQVTQLIQRIGRSGHELKRVSKGIIISTDEDDVFESAVIARKALKEELEEIKFHHNSLDVLAHQIVGLTFDFGKIRIEKAYEIIKRAKPYKNLNFEEFLEVCKILEKIGLIFLNGYIKKKRRGFEYYFSQLSTIPEVKQYKIINSLDNSFVGVLDEEFVAMHGEPNTSFIVKGEAWRILDVMEDKVFVEPTQDIEAAIPGWEGELIPVPFDVAQEVGKLRGIIKENLEGKEDEEIIQELVSKYPIDENCAKIMVEVIKKQSKFGIIPDEKTVLIEDVDDLVILHACFGSQINETLGRFISSLLTSRVGSVALRTDPYRIIIQFQEGRKNLELLKEILLETNPEHLKSYLELSLSRSELFAWKFVHVAKRFGVIKREADYGKLTLQKIINEYLGTPVFKEALKELETEKLDIEMTKEILKKIQSKEIALVFKPGLSFLGKIGLIHKFADLIVPEKPDREIFEIFKKRIMNSHHRLICLNCGNWHEVFVVKDISDKIICKKCGAKLLAITNPKDLKIVRIVQKYLRNIELNSGEREKLKRIKETAELFLNYGKKAAIVLAGRGVGPSTAKKILAKYHETEEDLIKDILESERKFLKTRKYWKI
ncbi:MAG: DEAD/DEAH box helicase [Candidatus Aenigmatarchaeota archaeon]